MLTFGTVLLHLGASVLGAVTSSLAVDWLHHQRKPAPRPPGPSTAGAPRCARRQLRQTGSVDPLVAVRRIVEAVPFYGPPAAAAMDVAREATDKNRPAPPKKKPPPKPKEGAAARENRAAKETEATPKETEATPKESARQEPPKGGDEKNQGTSEEKAEKPTMIMSDKASAKTVNEPPRELSAIVAGLAAADEEVGNAMAPVPPPVDYFVPGPGGKSKVISKERLKRWRQRYSEYRQEMAAYNSARAFDKQIEKQKGEIREQIRRAGSNNEVAALRRELKHVESLGKLSTRPRLFMNIDQDKRLGALVRGVLSGQRPQVTNAQGFEALIQSLLALAQAQAAPQVPPADPAAPFTLPPQVAPGTTAPYAAPPQPAPFTLQPGPAVAPMQAPVMAPPVALPPVAPSPAAPYALPPDQPNAVLYAPQAPPAAVAYEQFDPRLAPMDDYGGMSALADEGFGVIELEGACQCGGTCRKCRTDVGCASCAIGDVEDDDDLEGGAGPDDDLEGGDFDDDLEGGDFDDDLEGEDDDLEGGDFDDDLEGEDDDLEGGDFDDDLEGDDFDDEDE